MSSPQETHGSVPHELLIYEGGNGDSWYLCEGAAGLPAVKHVANPQSGGHISYVEVDSFLLNGNGPEHQALRQLLEQDHLSTVLIAYDIHAGQRHEYRDFMEAIRSLGSWWHHLETVWIVRSDKKPEQIRSKLASYIGPDDQLLVVDITRSSAEWSGINEAGSNWLKGHIDAAPVA